MQTVFHFLSQGFTNVAPFFILLGLLIFVHEFGHFIVARLCGVRVEIFSLGFGKKIFQRKSGHTTYCVSIIPLGGYVKMFGDDPTATIPAEERKYAFLHKPVLPRIAIVLAGPLMNLFFAVLLFMVIGRVGEELPSARVGDVPASSVAYQAGFRTGDKILKINGVPMQSWLDVQNKVEASPNQQLTFAVEHTNHQQAQIRTTPDQAANENILSYDREVGHIGGLSSESLAPVVGVINHSPADKAGLKTFDLVLAVGDQTVSSFSELESDLQSAFETGSAIARLKVRYVDAEEKPENTRVVELPLKEAKDLVSIGIQSAEMYIMKVKPGSPAAVAGVEAKDSILAIDEKPVKTWSEVLNRVKSFSEGGNAITFKVKHGDETKSLPIRPELTELMNAKGQEEKRFTIGVISGALKIGPEPVLVQITNPMEIVTHGFQQAAEWTGFTIMSLVRLAQGKVSAKNIGGVITIGRVASRSFEVGISAFLKTMAIISINLFLLNLLPVPVLDGGHLLFFSIEALKGTPISLKKLEIAQQVGLTLLIMLMAFALFNDVSNFFSSARW